MSDSYDKGYRRIGSDHSRFKDVLKGKIKKNFQKYIKNRELIGKQGDKIVKIPVPEIEIPRLRFDPNSSGGVSQGPGEVGDALGKGGDQKGKGTGEAGNEEGEHTFDAELTIDELANMLGEALQLPNIEPKEASGKTETSSRKYTNVNRTGPEGLRIFKKTYKKALLRTISSGEYDPENPDVIIPRREDKYYKYPKVIQKPDVKVVIFYIMDVSGSMSNEKREIVRTISYWLDLWLQKNYHDKLENRYIVHDTKAFEVDRDSFYKINTGGGTVISNAIKMCNSIIDKEYDPSIWNIYVFQFSDGDSWGQDDNITSAKLIYKLNKKVNQYSYCEINSGRTRDTFMHTLRQVFGLRKKIKYIAIEGYDNIPNVIKKFFG